ncbi:hypothetical protein X975_06065, partial [Stegodyphus mimosarum]
MNLIFKDLSIHYVNQFFFLIGTSSILTASEALIRLVSSEMEMKQCLIHLISCVAKLVQCMVNDDNTFAELYKVQQHICSHIGFLLTFLYIRTV